MEVRNAGKRNKGREKRDTRTITKGRRKKKSGKGRLEKVKRERR